MNIYTLKNLAPYFPVKKPIPTATVSTRLMYRVTASGDFWVEPTICVNLPSVNSNHVSDFQENTGVATASAAAA